MTDGLVHESDGTERTSSEFWHVAQGWAQAQFSPGELLNYMRELESRVAESRLREYFFGDLWDDVPAAARERLVNADLLWFSPQRVAVWDILNQLQVATENICHAFLWEPLLQADGGVGLLEFARRNRELQEHGFHPTLSDYAWLCRRPLFREFIVSLDDVSSQESFLTDMLLSALDKLRRERDSAQHDPRKIWRREEVEPFFRQFLGIGSPRVLLSLVKVGVMLVPRNPRKRDARREHH